MVDEHDSDMECAEYLKSKPVSQYELLELVQPLRNAMTDLLVAFIDISSQLVKSEQDVEVREVLMKGFEKIGPSFTQLEDFDLKTIRLLSGLEIDDDSEDDAPDADADE